MKLSDALEHQRLILEGVKQLNMNIQNASKDRVNIEIEVIDSNSFVFGKTPHIICNISINPQDID